MEGAGHVDPVAAAPLGGRDRGRAQRPSVLDRGSAVAEYLGDADLVQRHVRRAERGIPVVGVAAEPVCGGLRFAEQLAGRGPVAVDRGRVGGGFQQRPVHGKLLGIGVASRLDVADRRLGSMDADRYGVADPVDRVGEAHRR